MISGGWGTGGWGQIPWGGGDDGLRLLSAEPVRENVVRLLFSDAPRFTGVLDPGDASKPGCYAISPVAGTIDRDGLPSRPVAVIQAARSLVAGSLGRSIDLTVDRPFSPAPARYLVTTNGLVTAGGLLLLPGFRAAEFDGLAAGRIEPTIAAAGGRNDLSSPSSPLPIDASGDYAADERLVGFKKRIARRLRTRRGAFAHLPDYGVGVPEQIKRLARSSIRAALAAEAEEQIRREPETRSVGASIVREGPGVYRMRVVVEWAGGSFALSVPLTED